MGFLVSDKRAVRFDDDFVFVAVIDNGSLLIPWVQLDEESQISHEREEAINSLPRFDLHEGARYARMISSLRYDQLHGC